MKHRTRVYAWAVPIIICAAVLVACAPATSPPAQQSPPEQGMIAPTATAVSPSPTTVPTRQPTPTWVPTLPIITPTITPTPRPTSPPPTTMPREELLDLLAQAESAMLSLKSFQMDSEGQAVAGDAAISVVSASRIEMPDSVYTTTDAAGTKVESLQLDGDTFYRTADSGGWTPVSADSIQIPRIANPFAELQITSLGADLQQLRDGRLDGVLCYRFAFDMDLNDFLSRTGYSLQDLMLTDVNPFGVDFKREIWIGQGDLLLRLSLTELSFTYEGKPFEMTITNHLHSFDQPVDIPTP